MASCRDPEGWRARSQLRDFDLTPCFEEGVLLSSLLTVAALACLLRTFAICTKEPLERSRRSRVVLWAKLVSEMGWQMKGLCLTVRADSSFYLSHCEHHKRSAYRLVP
jgi:hypothetical protein